jgi:hypothetical protein
LRFTVVVGEDVPQWQRCRFRLICRDRRGKYFEYIPLLDGGAIRILGYDRKLVDGDLGRISAGIAHGSRGFFLR